MDPSRLLARLRGGDLSNVAFLDLERLLAALGFRELRIAGSHHILRHPVHAVIVNIQEVRGEARPYQLRQVLQVLDARPEMEEGLR